MSTIQSISNSANSSYSTNSAAQSAQAETSASVSAAGSGSSSSDATKALKVEEITRKNNTNISTAETSADAPEKEPSSDQVNEALKRAVEEINKNASNSEAQFAVHEGTNRIMVKIVDKETKEVIKEFPPEKTLDMIAKAWELAGLTIDERR